MRYGIAGAVAAVLLIAAPLRAHAAEAVGAPVVVGGSQETHAQDAAARRATVAVPLRFEVRNTNRTSVVCPTDGAVHALEGTLVAPSGALRTPHRAVTLYLHGRGTGEQAVWRSAIDGYHHVLEMARAGHASVVFDQLGYDKSSIPDGRLVCNGGQADIAHQVVQALRSGDYLLDGGGGIGFDRVALVGHSLGGQTAIVEAASFHDVDALGVLSYAEGGPDDPTAIRDFVGPAATCAAGGEAKRAGGATGYAHVMRDQSLEPFYDADPAVVAATRARFEQDACGELASAGATIAFTEAPDRAHETIDVPAFVATGDHDPIAPHHNAERTAGRLGTFARELDGTGHYLMLGRTAPAFRSELSAWLRENGF